MQKDNVVSERTKRMARMVYEMYRYNHPHLKDLADEVGVSVRVVQRYVKLGLLLHVESVLKEEK